MAARVRVKKQPAVIKTPTKMNSGLSKGFLEGLERSENNFQAKMRRIYEKYDHAFEDDIVVNIIDFTYSAPDGPIPWDFETRTTVERKHEKGKTLERMKEQRSALIQVFTIEDRSREILEEPVNTTCLLLKEQTSDAIFSKTFIVGEESEGKDSDLAQLKRYKDSYTTGNLFPSIKFSAGTKETCLIDGYPQPLMPYTSSNVSNKTFFVASLDTSVSMPIKSFIRRQNKDCSFEDTRDISRDFQADESMSQHSKETAYCNSGDTSLADHYPDMVECIRRLLELPLKKRAADNIIQYYKQHVWKAYKKLSTKQAFYRHFNFSKMHSLPLRNYETLKGCSRYKHTLCQSKHFNKFSFMESEMYSPRNKTLAANSNKDGNSILLDNLFTKQNKADSHEIGSYMKEKNRQLSVMKYTPIRRNICSMFSLIHRPKTKSKMVCRILDKTFTYQNQIDTDDANYSSYHNNTSQLSEVISLLPRSQDFPVLQTSCKSFIKQNQVESYKIASFNMKKQSKQTSMPNKRPETHVNSFFQENVKWSPTVAGTLPRTSLEKHSAMLKCKIDLHNTSLDNTFTYQNSLKDSLMSNFKEQDKPLPGSSFSAFPVLKSPRKSTVTLSSSMGNEATISYKTFIKQNQVENYKTDSIKHNQVECYKTDSPYSKEQKRQTFIYKNRPETHDDSFQNRRSLRKHSSVLKCKADPNNTSLDSTFNCQNSVDINEVKCFDRKEQDKNHSRTYSLIKRNSFSILPLMHNPKTNVRSLFNFNNTTLSLDKKVTYQDSKTLDRAASCSQALTTQLFKLDDPQAKHNSFSTLPVVYSPVREKKLPDVMFEDIYRVERRNGSHPNVRVQSSEMVWSQFNSTGSRRSKRKASTNVCFSALKRQRSADETFIQSNTAYHSVDNSPLFWRETTDSLPNISPETKLQVKAYNTGC